MEKPTVNQNYCSNKNGILQIFGVNMTFSSETEYIIANSVIASTSTQESFVGAWNMERNVSPVVYSR